MDLRRAGTGGHRLDRRFAGAAAVLGPAVISFAWVPLRRHLPNVDVALALVLAVTACGAIGRRSYVVLAAVGAATGFAFFDTQPYEQWVVSRQPDLETLVMLVVVSLVTGELAMRFTRLRSATTPSPDDMSRVRDIAALVASGAELVSILGTVGDELTRLLGASDCSYEAGESPVATVTIGRDGIARPHPGLPGRRPAPPPPAPGDPAVLEVPVTGMGRVLGRFVVTDPTRARTKGRLLMALTLADQVGAALIAQAPESAAPDPAAPATAAPDGPPEQPTLRPALRVVK